MGTQQVYEVPVIFHGLRQPEAYLQVCDALDNLNHVVDEVFSRITSRVFTEKSKLEALSSRLSVAHSKVQQIVGTSKAITVFSSAKYPAPNKRADYVPLYTDNRTFQPKFNNYKLQDVPMTTTGIEEQLDASELLLIETGSITTKLNEVGTVEGLGRLPARIPSVSSLLLFNSRENPYKKYAAMDNLAGGDSKKIQASTAKVLTAAPDSVVKGDALDLPGMVEYGYRPVLGDVPEFNLPAVLPNLANVADINWSVAENNGIAPSQNLPVFNFDIPPTTQTPGATAAPATGSAPAPPPPSSSGGPPPPPPPPSSAPPPPPPGPPPPPPPKAKAADGMEELPSTSGARNDLLESIRAGKKLKKVSESAPKNEAPKPKAAAAPAGDLFGDLITALNRRRQGIASKQKTTKKKEDEEDIKAPPKEADAEDDESDGEEWQ
jgi:WAS family protein 1